MKRNYGCELAESGAAETGNSKDFNKLNGNEVNGRPESGFREQEEFQISVDNSREELRKFLRAVNQSSSLIIITDKNGIIEYVNPKFTAVTGYEPDEVKGKTPAILKSGETPAEEYEKLWTTIISAKEWHGEFHNKKKNGELFWDLSSISPVQNDSGEVTHFICVKEDITQRKASEEELRKAREIAEKSEKLKSEFLAQISHEIRTPVNTMMSFISLIKDEMEGRLTEELKSGFKMIDNGAKRLIRTIDLLLDMSQVQSGNLKINPEEIDLGKEVLENQIFYFHSVARLKGLQLIYTNDEQSTVLRADLYTVNQIFENLIDNAIKFTPRGTVEIKVYRDNRKRLCVDIKDTGVGISEEYLPNLFTPFSQEKTGYTRQFDGNGLGLALVEQYAGLNNAEIKVKSRKNEGSVFTVVFS
ncbi:MAG: PAS domain S-box protein [Bacteroidota bacterium]|jgi:PAS domain S-box-containing protein|nr:PAS domain S-box protein [Ignavibacteria bacterium]